MPPFLLIIGAQKAGTTTVYDMLFSADGFSGAKVKEIGFFTKNIFYEQGENWYFQQFNSYIKNKWQFEATPEYLYYPDVPRRISVFGKPVKFIVLLREPSARCYSAWNMFRGFNKHNANQIYEVFTKYSNPPIREAMKNLLFTDQFPSFQQAVVDDIKRYESGSPDLEPSFVRRGIYYDQIQRFIKYFPLSDFLFIEQCELDDPILVLNKISSFLLMEINIKHIPTDLALKSNAGTYEKTEDSAIEAIKELKEFYRPHNTKLFELIGFDYGWNS